MAKKRTAVLELARPAPPFSGMLRFRKGAATETSYHVEFSMIPKVGDNLNVELISAKANLKKECYWTVVDVSHSVDLEPNKDDSEPRTNPVVSIEVTVEPRKTKSPSQSNRHSKPL